MITISTTQIAAYKYIYRGITNGIRRGDLNKIINQDCIAGIKELEDESVDIVVTSPPYNLNISYGAYDDNLTQESYLEWIGELFIQIYRVLKHNGHLWMNVGYSNINPYIGNDVLNVARKVFTLQNNIIWVKSISIDDDRSYDHYKPINSNRFANPTWENLYHFTKRGDVPCDKLAIGVPYVHKPNLKEGQADVRCRGNVWYIPYETICNRESDRGNHPATYPVELVDKCIKFSGIKEGILVDPFMGSGTSAIGAIDNDLDYIGYDIDAGYIQYANDRINRHRLGLRRSNVEPTVFSNLFR